MKPKVALCADVGGTNTRIGVVREDGVVLSYRKASTPAAADAFIDVLAEELTCNEHLMDSRLDSLLGVSIGIPGVVDPQTGSIRHVTNLPGWNDICLADIAGRALGVRVAVEHDVKLAMLGENWMGAARGALDMVYLNIGTGIAASFLSGGRIIRGSTGVAGSVGYLALSPGEVDERFDPNGYFEYSASGPGILRRAVREGNLNYKTAHDVFGAAEAGDDEVACRLVEAIVTEVGIAISVIVATLNPSVVVLGGGIGTRMCSRISRIREIVNRHVCIDARMVEVIKSELGDVAALVGGAAMFANSQYCPRYNNQ